MITKNYILSQRTANLALGAVIGFVLGMNQKPLNYYLVGAFVFICAGLSYWYGKKIDMRKL